MNVLKFSLVVFGGLVIAPVLSAQSFNLDLDIGFGGPTAGEGSPSELFPGMALQPGYWGLASAGGPSTPVRIADLKGQPTGITLVRTPYGGGSNGSNHPLMSGDFELLMADGGDVYDHEYKFSGMKNGRYKVYTYVGEKTNQLSNRVEIEVPGAIVPILQVITAPIVANTFTDLVTHTVHDVEVKNGEVSVKARVAWPQMGRIMGFQFVRVN
jgi:hypothetical protein